MKSAALGFGRQRSGFKRQRGGFTMGLVIGLLLGLVLALGVALYVTKVPVPFINKVPQRTAEQDAAEIEKNKNWDPNAPLYGKSPAKPAAPASAAAAVSAASAAGATVARAASAAASAASTRDPAAILAGKALAGGASQAASTKPGPDPFSYFVQAGAYAAQEEAEQQRARLAIIGFEAKLTEREQAGRTMYRVRVGPFDQKDDADAAKEKLNDAGVESALVRVQR